MEYALLEKKKQYFPCNFLGGESCGEGICQYA